MLRTSGSYQVFGGSRRCRRRRITRRFGGVTRRERRSLRTRWR